MIETFVTAGGARIPAITAGQMCTLRELSAQAGGPGMPEITENAGRSLCGLVLESLGPDWVDAHVVVLAGTGDVAAGGICAARHLVNRKAEVTVILADPRGLTALALEQMRVYAASGGREAGVSELQNWSADLVVDALAQSDLRSAPDSGAAKLIQWANGCRAPIISLDVPAGLDSTTGDAHDFHIRATKTLTLALPKTGLSPAHTGELLLADVGLPSVVIARLGVKYDSPFDHRYTIPLFVG